MSRTTLARHAQATPSRWWAWAIAGLLIGAFVGAFLGAWTWDVLT